jgi:hypothetical protein
MKFTSHKCIEIARDLVRDLDDELISIGLNDIEQIQVIKQIHLELYALDKRLPKFIIIDKNNTAISELEEQGWSYQDRYSVIEEGQVVDKVVLGR